jgi:hypothetical protein
VEFYTVKKNWLYGKQLEENAIVDGRGALVKRPEPEKLINRIEAASVVRDCSKREHRHPRNPSYWPKISLIFSAN